MAPALYNSLQYNFRKDTKKFDDNPSSVNGPLVVLFTAPKSMGIELLLLVNSFNSFNYLVQSNKPNKLQLKGFATLCESLRWKW